MNSIAITTRLDRIKRMPCVCCSLIPTAQPHPTEIHHLVDKGNRRASGGHMATIPLCMWHHRAVPRLEIGRTKMLMIYGPSLKFQGGKGEFSNRWGTERELLAITNQRLERIAA